ncbi:MAG: 2-hydroxyacyl-CoA dehydratase family protein, partial [Pseudomonadota bacterium]
MSLLGKIKFQAMKDIGAPALMAMGRAGKKKKPRKDPPPYFGPPLQSAKQLKEMMTRHYFLARYAKGARPVAWVTSGAPVELLRVFDFYTVYPENHGALCGAARMGSTLCQAAEEHGYHQDLCSYARIDLGHHFTGQTPAGRLPRPDLLFASNNICQTVMYWYKCLAHYWNVPLLLFDAPYNFGDITRLDIDFMVAQLKEMIPILEGVSGKRFSRDKFSEILALGKETSLLWGQVLAMMKHRPAPMTIFDAFVHLAPVVSLRGLKVSHNYYKLLLAELEERVAKGVGAVIPEKKRLMWDNIAIWFKVREFAELFASHGMNFVAATYTNAWAETIHHLDDTQPFESMARAYGLVILNNNLNH